ncbi:MAG: hypothetical protein IKC59_04650 [Clostridia bacterium]|nr:hypothetical protein [Clostridia bacterium]
MIYKNPKTKNISFPLGGIGSGCIGLAGNGELRDWEIFNRPNKDSRNGYSHFAVKATCSGKSEVRVLHGDTNENLIGGMHGSGPRANSLAGYPHFKNVTFEGDFPIARLTFSDQDFPIIARLCAFNPLIPHDEFNSSLPVAFFEWEIENPTQETVNVALACTVRNPSKSAQNKKVSTDHFKGVFLGCSGIDVDDREYADLCILTDAPDSVVQEYWYRGMFMDSCTTYWKNLLCSDRIPERSYSEPSNGDHGTVVSYVDIPAGEKTKLRFIISWNAPVGYHYWGAREEDDNNGPVWRNYYATQFKDSFASAKYALEHFKSLYEKTVLFSDALQSCTLSDSVKDAVCANLSVLKTPTSLRLEDGSFWGWEGCHSQTGSCFGSCQHVWNYAYAMPYLFPRLERSMRENNIKYALQESGATGFRINLPLKNAMDTARACLDGQMGEVIKCYREWKFSGDDEWLKKHSESIFKMLEYAWSAENPDQWDADMDGVLEGRQHHTLDIELFGPSSWLQGFYLLALDCGAEMASYLGEESRASLYKALYQKGRAWTNEHLFNGSYFCQKIDLSDKSLVDRFGASDIFWNQEAREIKYQVADGCIIDQMLADWHAALIGMPRVFDPEKKKTALRNLYQNNFKASMRAVTNMWRNFALNDEQGTVICSYPDGVNTPAIPIPYCEETMTGFEYSLAGLMIAEGFVSEGETVVKAVRDRYDGEKRNPWDEIECGSNYARSMASYALMPIYSGFTADMTQKHIGFAPITREGRYLFSVCESWGTVEFNDGICRIRVLGNPLTLQSIAVPNCTHVKKITVDGAEIDFRLEDGKLLLGEIKIEKEIRL